MSSGGLDALFLDGGYFTLAASVLCCYDHAITLSEEVRCVWRRRISGASVLFIVNRYAILAGSLVSIVQVLPWNTTLGGNGGMGIDEHAFAYDKVCERNCSASVRFIDACLIVVNLAYTVFAAFRIFALYDLSKRVFWLVFFAGVLNPCAQVFLMAMESTGTNRWYDYGPIGYSLPWGRINCYHNIRASLCALFGDSFPVIMNFIFPVLRLHALIFEVILIVLTWKKTATRWGLQESIAQIPFTTLLQRDGTIYFAIIALASGLNMLGMMIYCLSPKPQLSHNTALMVLSLTGPLVDTLTSICMSHFILGLLALTLDDGNARINTSQWRTICFAPAVETFGGNSGSVPPTGDIEEDCADVVQTGIEIEEVSR